MTAMDAYVFPKFMPITAGTSSVTVPLAFSGTFPFATDIEKQRERVLQQYPSTSKDFAFASLPENISGHVIFGTATSQAESQPIISLLP